MGKRNHIQPEPSEWEEPIPAGGRIMRCPSCGAPVTAEICDECGAETGMHPVTGNMEYQQMECKSVVMDDTKILMPTILAVVCGFAAVAAADEAGAADPTMLLISLLCAVGSIAGIVILMRNLLQYIQVKSKGESVRAKVCGYTNDTMKIKQSKQYTKIVKLLAETSGGRKLIFYRLYKPVKPYPVGQNIEILIYKDLVLIPKNQKNHR